ncbi:uncharacterized protein LOC130781047 [Actinidia eriantha]|uniref:uncharacterized protein LOC130781047 n=1 Tax=Actinidia eriantha TaxID=165200 RepID=UPI002584A6DB|nr:uncharacterized protein LOC130781047 [Actinidia eriantha]
MGLRVWVVKEVEFRAMVKGIMGRWIMEVSEVNEKKRKQISEDDVEDFSIDGSGLTYHSDEFLECNKVEESGKNSGNSSNANSTVTRGDQKGKKKGFPDKNLMAERRCQKNLNDRLYMLRGATDFVQIFYNKSKNWHEFHHEKHAL